MGETPNGLEPGIAPLPLPAVAGTHSAFNRPRVIIALVLVAVAMLLMLVSVVTGYLDYTSPISVMIREEIARSMYQVSSSQVVSELELSASPMSTGMVGSILLQGTTLLALACFVGAWVVMVTGSSDEPVAEGRIAPDERDESASEGDAGPFFD